MPGRLHDHKRFQVQEAKVVRGLRGVSGATGGAVAARHQMMMQQNRLSLSLRR